MSVRSPRYYYYSSSISAGGSEDPNTRRKISQDGTRRAPAAGTEQSFSLSFAVGRTVIGAAAIKPQYKAQAEATVHTTPPPETQPASAPPTRRARQLLAQRASCDCTSGRAIRRRAYVAATGFLNVAPDIRNDSHFSWNQRRIKRVPVV